MPLLSLGSPTALSLAALEDTKTIVSAGIVLVVSAAVFSYRSFKHYRAKTHRHKIEKINELHKKFLETIIVPGYGKIAGFPPIFKFLNENSDSPVDFMHFNSDQIEQMGLSPSQSFDPNLSTYRLSIKSALLKLKNYYFDRKKYDDMTANVLTYLLYMIESKCLNFAGYDYDIAYITAISDFINAYASMKGIENSQHFSRLNPVYAYLLSAKQSLELHKKCLSMEDLVNELQSCCTYYSEALIRILLKLTIDRKYFSLVDTAALDEINEGRLRQEYIHTEIKGWEIFKDHQVMIPNSIFKTWIQSLTHYYLEALSSEVHCEEQNFPSPKVHYLQVQNLLASNHLGQLNEIYKVFRKARNFLTTQLDPKHLQPKYISLNQDKDVFERVAIIADFGHLIHLLISLQNLSVYLLKSIKQLGDIYIKNPHHFIKIFSLLESLCQLIQEQMEQNKTSFTKIQKQNKNFMHLDQEEILPKKIAEIFETVSLMLNKILEKIKKYRQKISTSQEETTEESAQYEILEVAKKIMATYQINLPEKPALILSKPQTQNMKLLDSPRKSTHAPIIRKIRPLPVTIAMVNAQNNLVIEQETPLQTLQRLLPKIHQHITDAHETRMSSYIKLYQQLIIITNKGLQLLQKITSPQTRQHKGHQLLLLNITLSQHFFNYLSLSSSERATQTQAFINTIHQMLSDKKNAWIDQHYNPISRFFANHLNRFGLFRTDSRKKLMQFERMCETQLGRQVIC